MYRRLDLNRRCGRMAGLHGLQKQKLLYHHNDFKKMSSIILSRRKFISNIWQKEIR
jgi:hypothetical protein